MFKITAFDINLVDWENAVIATAKNIKESAERRYRFYTALWHILFTAGWILSGAGLLFGWKTAQGSGE